jgi:predicted kinase
VEQTETASDVRKLLKELGQFPEAWARPFLIVISGLPGTGKSHFCRHLAQKLAAVILESDHLRRALFPLPGYGAAESARLFRASHLLIERLLRDGIPVIFDATNLSQHYREKLYRIAEHLDIKLVLVRVEAPPELVYQRLRERQGDPETNSEADWAVYQRMRPKVQRIRRRHYAVDTSWDIDPVIEKIVKEVNR